LTLFSRSGIIYIRKLLFLKSKINQNYKAMKNFLLFLAMIIAAIMMTACEGLIPDPEPDPEDPTTEMPDSIILKASLTDPPNDPIAIYTIIILENPNIPDEYGGITSVGATIEGKSITVVVPEKYKEAFWDKEINILALGQAAYAVGRHWEARIELKGINLKNTPQPAELLNISNWEEH